MTRIHDSAMEMAIRNLALLTIKHPKCEDEFWQYADKHDKEDFESYVFFGVVHTIAWNREYRELHDIHLTDKELTKARDLAQHLLDDQKVW